MNKTNQYSRIYDQLNTLIYNIDDIDARRATLIALLYHKIKAFSWVGYYIYNNYELIVNQYQGPLACIILKKNTGVCWKCYNEKQVIIVPDVEKFEGHIACDPNTKSEITIPIYNRDQQIIGVFDADSKMPDAFDMTDAQGLTKLINLVEKTES